MVDIVIATCVGVGMLLALTATCLLDVYCCDPYDGFIRVRLSAMMAPVPQEESAVLV